MSGWKQTKDPKDVPRKTKLRERARALKGQAEGLLKEADALLAEAEQIESKLPKDKRSGRGIKE